MHLSLIGVVGGIADQIDSLLVFHFLGAAELAIYSFAVALPEQIRGTLKNIYPIMLPAISRHEKTAITAKFNKSLFQLGALGACAAGIYIVAAPFIFKFLFPQYTASVGYSEIYSFVMIFSTMGLLPLMVLQTKQATKELYSQNLIGQIVTIGVLVLGVYWYGLIGVIGGKVITEIFRFILIVFLSRKAADILSE
jgi:PST family polysaccharide transporter